MNSAPSLKLSVEMPLPVRSYDIDYGGVVSNIVYVRWLEDMRFALLERHYPLAEQLRENIAPAVIKTEIEYKKPVRLTDQVVGRMWLKEIKGTRIIVSAEIATPEEIKAVACQTGVFVNLEKMRPIKPPARILDLVNQ